MKINLKATNLTLTPPINNYLAEKLATLEKLLPAGDESVRADVELARVTKRHRQGEVFKAEINLHLAGFNCYAAETAEEPYAAIDLVRDEIARQIKTRTEKRHSLLRRGGRRIKNMLRRLYPWTRR